MSAQSGPIVAKLLVTGLFLGPVLLGCALLHPDHAPLSDSEWLAVPLWFSPAEPRPAPTVSLPADYAPAPEFAIQAPASFRAIQVPTEYAAIQPPQTPETAFEEAWLGVQSRLDALETTLHPGAPGTSYSPQHGALPTDGSRASQYREDLIAREKLKALATGQAEGGRQAPATFWINHAPGAYAPALRFRAPLNFVRH